MGEGSTDSVKFVMVDEHRNSILGLFIFVGFLAFFIVDKTMRTLTGGHSHEHKTDHKSENATTGNSTGSSSSVQRSRHNLRQRKLASNSDATPTSATKSESPEFSPERKPVRASAYLNLIADATHNVTDGLAITASFYISPTIGAITTVAVFCHEIPHEVSDYAILLQSGFTKWQAMSCQFLTAGGAFLGTILGILVNSYSIGGNQAGTSGVFGSSVTVDELLLPVTAGGFLYIATSGVIPDLLEVNSGKVELELRKLVTQVLCMCVGIAFMFLV